ncbi:cell wall hydrolase [Paludifilum halophilum]|uniref:Cell wall hydrolase n=1 Tax=Paludifilum halophilum TaxID=1642702 RepID=A0A235BA80_9BACL|nr:cell wall hydrolase [Paludifilum halophilum]OYD09132.1 cell wall hydrolase [Paludifilum halophilum]
MAVVRTNSKQTKLLARLMRAEAEEDGEMGMLLVGNVGVNRVIARCLDFEDIRTLKEMIFQAPGGFEAVQRSYFYQRAREREIRLARQVINGARFDPARFALWFFAPDGNCPPEWFGQALSGRYKSHCFFLAPAGECPNVY